jgi:integral membrane protein
MMMISNTAIKYYIRTHIMALNVFRIISYLEGISYLLLLGVGVPLKYLANNDAWVKALGMPHGLLFVAYIVMAVVIRTLKDWDNKTTLIVLIASVIPFGTFYIDRKYLKD